MLDVNIIRKDPESIRMMLANRNMDDGVLNRFLEADGEWKVLMDQGNRLRQERNTVSARSRSLAARRRRNASML